MAEIQYQILQTPLSGASVILVVWRGLRYEDTGIPYPCPHYADRSVHVTGTFGTGGNCRIQGSNVDVSPTFVTLNDTQGNALDINTPRIKQILENSYWVRPNITGGDGTTNLDVYLLIHTTK